MKKCLLLLLPLFALSCDKEQPGLQSTYTGTLQRQGATNYQYGTHTLSTATTFYALTSSRVGLDVYIGQNVTITGRPVSGYPVNGGPPLIEVETIQ